MCSRCVESETGGGDVYVCVNSVVRVQDMDRHSAHCLPSAASGTLVRAFVSENDASAFGFARPLSTALLRVLGPFTPQPSLARRKVIDTLRSAGGRSALAMPWR